IMLAQSVQNSQRRAIHPPCDAMGHLIDRARAARHEPTGIADDGLVFDIADERGVDVVEGFLMRAEEALDAGEEKTDAAFAVREDESPRGQAATPPALDRFAGDAETFGEIVNREHRLIERCAVLAELIAQLLDEQTEIVLQRQAREQVG